MSTRWYCSAIPSLPTLAGSSLPLGLGPWALASIVWISVDQNQWTGVSLEAPEFDPQMAGLLAKNAKNNGAHPGGFGASISRGSKVVIWGWVKTLVPSEPQNSW